MNWKNERASAASYKKKIVAVCYAERRRMLSIDTKMRPSMKIQSIESDLGSLLLSSYIIALVSFLDTDVLHYKLSFTFLCLQHPSQHELSDKEVQYPILGSTDETKSMQMKRSMTKDSLQRQNPSYGAGIKYQSSLFINASLCGRSSRSRCWWSGWHKNLINDMDIRFSSTDIGDDNACFRSITSRNEADRITVLFDSQRIVWQQSLCCLPIFQIAGHESSTRNHCSFGRKISVRLGHTILVVHICLEIIVLCACILVFTKRHTCANYLPFWSARDLIKEDDKVFTYHGKQGRPPTVQVQPTVRR